MRLDFLGTGAGSFRGSRRGSSGALLDSLLLDCGAGVPGRLFDIGRFDDVEAVLVSHLHSDHIAGLFDLLTHTVISNRTRPLTVVAPPGLGAILAAVFAVHGTVKRPEEVYPFRLVEGSAVDTRIGRWGVRSVPMDHTVPNLGYVLTADGLSAFYSGDTREPSAARSERVDYLIHEATFPERQTSIAHAYGHTTSTEAADSARAMGARRLWITHVAAEHPDDEQAIQLEARRVFPDSEVVQDLGTYRL